MRPYQSGDFVKVEFKDDRTGKSEWMWVKVDKCDEANRLVFGWLDNEPVVHPESLRVGQRLVISYDNVKEHRRSSDT